MSPLTLFFCSLSFAVALLSSSSCSTPTSPASPALAVPTSPRLVLLYATCTLNKKYLSPYNPAVSFTPALEAFSREAQVFTKHRTEAGLSGVAFAALFSGVQASGHGVFTHPTPILDSTYLISQAFAENGYEVFYWNQHGMASADLNYAKGIPPDNNFLHYLQADDEKFHEILQKLQTDKTYRAFIITNFSVTHSPYTDRYVEDFCHTYPAECQILHDLPVEKRDQYIRLHPKNQVALKYNFRETVGRLGLSPDELLAFARVVDLLYRSSVNFLDQLFGRVRDTIQAAGLLDESLIVFTADHGESLHRDTGFFSWSHGHTLQADVLDIPLIIRAPGQDVKPGRADYVTRSIDVFPTLAGLSDLALLAEADLEGIDLSRVLRGMSEIPTLSAYSHSAMLPPALATSPVEQVGFLKQFYPEASIALSWVAVQVGHAVWKYRQLEPEKWTFSAYNLDQDPHEVNDIFDASNSHHQQMAEQLVQYKAKLEKAYAQVEELRIGTQLLGDAETRRRLRSLGYIQ